MILGSFPGQASLREAQYYAHPQNQFWRLLGAILDEPLSTLAYDARLNTLLAHRIGLWDVIASCQRAGSLDAAIRDEQRNDFSWLTSACPKLERICFNGLTAARLERPLAALGYATHVLPSSSPAYTLKFEAKLARWRAALDRRS